MKPKTGQWLKFSCSADVIGPILSVGEDANGIDTIDVVIPNINEFVNFNAFGDDSNALTEIETTGPVIFRDLQYRVVPKYDDVLELNTPGDLCYLCTVLCTICEEREAKEIIEMGRRTFERNQ